MTSILRCAFMILGGLLFSPMSNAVCTLNPDLIVNYGSQSSFVVKDTTQTQNINLQLTCPNVLSVAAPSYINIKYANATATTAARALMKTTPATSDGIPLVVGCISPTCTTPTEITIPNSVQVTESALLNLPTGKTYTLPLSISTVTGQSIAAGSYSATLNFEVSWSICTVGTFSQCMTADSGNGNVNVTVNLNVLNDCATITAPNINFSSAPIAGSFTPQSSTISLVCTKGAVYTVGINNGNNAVSNLRRMNSGANYLSYDIFQSTTNNRWGSVGSERWSSSSASTTSADTMTKTFNYVAKIFPTQATPPAGTYNDTLLVDVAF